MSISTRAFSVVGAMALSLAVASCGGDNTSITTGADPRPGTFRGVTSAGGTIVIEVSSIRSIFVDCLTRTIAESFNPPLQIVGGSFTALVEGVTVSGFFQDNNTLINGDINDPQGDCTSTFTASREVSTSPTRTSTPGPADTATPTPEATDVPTETPTGEVPTETPTPDPNVPTPTATSTPGDENACPDMVEFEADPDSPNSILDAGFSGLAHNQGIISDGKITVNVNCASETRPCGTCPISGPVRNIGASDLQSQRCASDTSIECTSNADCPSNGTCAFFLGGPLGLSAGGTSTCVLNQVEGQITGQVNVETGVSTSNVILTSRVFLGPETEQPCPRCVGDGPDANDGIRGGTCDIGPRAGQPCDVSGVSTTAVFGPASLDCPPNPGSNIANLFIDLDNTTGNASVTLSNDNPPCRASGTTDRRCYCDTCNVPPNQACFTDADCPGQAAGSCGGLRCLGGANTGNPCDEQGFDQDDCAAPCGQIGEAPAPNGCANPDDCTAQGGCMFDFDGFCRPMEPFRTCLSAADCPQPGDDCMFEAKRCFPGGGVVGTSVTVQGQADAPQNGVANPVLASSFCIGATSSTAANVAAGLPGLGTVTLGGTACEIIDGQVAAACP